MSSRLAVEITTDCMLLLLPVAAEKDAVYRGVHTYLLLHPKFGMGSVTYIPKTSPVALPKQQRRCVVMVGYIDKANGDSEHA